MEALRCYFAGGGMLGSGKNHKAAGSAGGGVYPIVPGSHKAFLSPLGKLPPSGEVPIWRAPLPFSHCGMWYNDCVVF